MAGSDEGAASAASRRMIHRVRKCARRHPLFVILIFILVAVVTAFFQFADPDDFVRGSYFLDEAPGVNPWFEIILPPAQLIPEATQFKYPKLLVQTTDCINRSSYTLELIRLFRVESGFNASAASVLVVGAKTAVGLQVVKKLRLAGHSVISIDGPTSLDFASLRDFTFLQFLNISKAIVCINPIQFRHARSNPAATTSAQFRMYLMHLSELFNTYSINYVVMSTPPHIYDLSSHILWLGGSIQMMPHIIDWKSLYDISNPLMRFTRECELVGRATVRTSDQKIHSITSDEAADFLIRKLFNFRKEIASVRGRSQTDIRSAVGALLRHYPNCRVTYHPLALQINQNLANLKTPVIGKSRSIPKAYRTHPINVTESPYLSIVVAGTNENSTFRSIAQDWINSIGRAIRAVPLADVEIVFVEQLPPVLNQTSGPGNTSKSGNSSRKRTVNRSKLAEALLVPASLRNKVRFIMIPAAVRDTLWKSLGTNLTFLEYPLKNAGIRRARGRFVLVTNPYIVLPVQFFEFVAERQFNDAIIYRALRADEREAHSIGDIEDAIEDFWSFETTLNLTRNCKAPNERATFVRSVQDMRVSECPCGIADFLMLSRQLMVALGGFNEYPATEWLDWLIASKLWKLIPGFVVQFLVSPVVKRWRAPVSGVRLPNLDLGQTVSDFECLGDSYRIRKFGDYPQWGLSTMEFKEVVK